METKSEMAHMLELADKDFRSTITARFKSKENKGGGYSSSGRVHA